jgi:gliding motility-associated-like protein
MKRFSFKKLALTLLSVIMLSSVYASTCDTICSSTNSKMYYVNKLTNTSGYRWTINNGIRILTGQGSDTVFLDFRFATTGTALACITAFNDCDTMAANCFSLYIKRCDPGILDTIIVIKTGNPITIGSAVIPPSGSSISSQLSGPNHGSGSASVTNNGVVTFVPNNKPFVGKDTIMRIVCINTLCDTSFIFINNPSVVNRNYDTTFLNTTVTVAKIKPYQFEGTKVTTTVSSNRAIYDSITGNLIYTPAKDFLGNDTITVSRCDNRGNCVTDIFIFTVIDKLGKLPNYFSPNGDGTNDKWKLPASYYTKYKTLKLIIYNRWGNVVWRSVGNYKDDFDGNNLKTGEMLPDGVYYYMLELDPVFKTVETGFIELMRQ